MSRQEHTLVCSARLPADDIIGSISNKDKSFLYSDMRVISCLSLYNRPEAHNHDRGCFPREPLSVRLLSVRLCQKWFRSVRDRGIFLVIAGTVQYERPDVTFDLQLGGNSVVCSYGYSTAPFLSLSISVVVCFGRIQSTVLRIP